MPPRVIKSNQQFVFIHDAICEGPIEGLVYGDSSVYLNDSRLRDVNADSAFNPVKGQITFSGTTGAIQTDALPIQLLGTPENDNYLIIRGGAIAKSNASYNGGIFTITGSSSFNSNYTTNAESDVRAEFKKIVLVDPLTDTIILQGEGKLNGTNLDFVPDSTMQYLEYLAYLGTTNSYNVELVESVKINTIASATSITTDAAPLLGNGSYSYRIAGSIAPNADEETAEAPAKVDNTTVQFRKGSTFQNPISELNGSASGTPYTGNLGNLSNTQLQQISPATATTLGIDIYSTLGYPEGETPDGSPVEINAVSLFGSTAAATLDEIRVSIAYPSLVAVNKENGDDLSNTAINLFQIKIKKPGETSFTGWRNAFRVGENVGQIKHVAETKTNISFEHYIDLEPFKPFTDFTVRVTRISRHLGKGLDRSGADYNDSVGDTDQGNSTGAISGVTGINKDKFTYPYTAHAGVFLDSREFSSVPKRSYELRGMKVRVPEGYTPREYTNGASPEYPSFWDGSLSEELYYTDNPAWVFYDLIANDRFGAGEWITESDIDLFALYRISKYCDELVDDGKGGLEPRFRANVFLTKATDVYKVLKDMATIFTSIIYWMDGKMTTILDAPGDPIYNFSKANVIEGSFAYESTGEKTRVNQVVVTWNDPEAGYEQRPLVVEDRNSIIQAGRIVKQAAFAFGCTSEGQARRYGKWKLFTAQGQTEIVSFKASLDGAFLKPGDIIQIQDSDRYGTKLSGRISGSSTSNGNSVIDLDRTITLNNTAAYELTVLITEPAAFYVGTSTSIDTVSGTINKGDRVPSAWIDHNNNGTRTLQAIDTEEKASNAWTEETDGEPLSLTWSEHTYVESLPVTGSQTTSQLTTTGGYSSLPGNNSVWMLTETESGAQTVGSADLYRILAVSQEEKNVYGISAVEHYNEKYDFIDNPEAILDIPDDVYPTEPEFITAPSQVYVLQTSESSKPNEELTIQWDYPEFIDTGVTDQNNNAFPVESSRFLDGFELFHTIPNIENPITVGKRQRKYPFSNVPDGNYIFRVRAVSVSENKSAWASARYLVEDPFKDNVNRIKGLQTEGLTTHFPYITNALGTNRGAYTNTTYSANDVVTEGGNSYSLSGSPSNVGGVSVAADNTANPGTWTLTPSGILKFNDEGENVVLAPSRFKTDDTVELSTGYQLDCSPIAAVGFPGVAGGNPRSAYVVLDHSSSALKLIKADFNTDLNIFYWQDLSVFSPTNSNAVWNNLAGTVTVAAKSNKVVGVGTSFTSLNNLSKLKFDNGTIVKGARVAYVESNTVLYLDRNIGPDAFVGASGDLKVQNYAPDFRKDVIIGQVLYNITNGVYRFKNFMSLDPSLVGGRAVFLDSNVAFAQFDARENPILLPDSIIVDATATGFETPEFKITYGGTGDAEFLAEDSSFSTATPNPSKYEKTIYTNSGSNDLSYDSGTAYEITVEVREANDPGNTDKQRSDTFSIFKVDGVAAGEGAKIVNLELEDYSIVYDADGENPAFNQSSGSASDITITATASPGFVNPVFRFTIDGTQGSWVSSADNTSTETYTVPQTIQSWNSGNGGTRVFSVEVAEQPDNFPTVQPVAEDIKASDSASLLAVQVGQGGLAIVLNNPTHSLTADENGVVSSNVGSGTTIEVFVGGVGIDYVTSNPTLGEWTISSIGGGGADITPGTPSASGTGPVVAAVPDHTFSAVNALDDQEAITYTITVPQGAGKAALTAQAIQTFSLSKGAAPSTTASLVFLYAASSTQPADIGTGFPNVTVDLATGLISGYTNPSTDTAAVTNWYDSAEGAAAGASSTDKIWVVAATGNGTGSTDTIAFGEWSSSVQFTGTDGFNTATIELYHLSTSDTVAPNDPTQGLTYTFSPANLSTNGIGSWSQSRPEPSRAFPYVWRISAAAVSNTATDTIDTNDWSAGIIVDRFIEDGITLELTNDAETVGATTLSTALSGLSLATTAKVFQAGTDITSAWGFSAVASTGITVSQSTNTFTVTDLTSGFTQGNVTITATANSPGTYAGADSRSVNFTITKVANGADGVSYRINPTSAVVSYDSNGTSWSPTSVTFTATKVTPTGASAFTAGYWKLNGANQGQQSSVSSNTISATSGNITAQLYLDSGYTELVDTESVPIVPSGTNGQSVTGPTGNDAALNISGYMYWTSTGTPVSSNIPGASSSYQVDYDFDSPGTDAAFTASDITGWSHTAPTAGKNTAGSIDRTTVYYVTYSAAETMSGTPLTGNGDGTATFSSSVSTAFNFTGLVTFTDLSTSGSTTIRGDNITTGSIKSIDYVDNTGSFFANTGVKFDLANDVIETPYFYSGPSGAGFKGSITLSSSSDLTIDGNTLSAVALNGLYSSLSGTPTLSTVATSGSYNDLGNLPTLFDGNYNNLSNLPTLFDGNYNNLSNSPTIPSDIDDLNDAFNLLFSGDYGDLSNQPTIPTALDQLTNNIGAITGVSSGSNSYASVSASKLVINPTNIVGATTAVTAVNSGSSTYASISSNQLTITPSAIVLATDAVTSVVDGDSQTGFIALQNNVLTLTPSAISITSLSGVGDLASQNEADLDYISSSTSISAGKIVLASGTLDFTTSTPTVNNSIVLDTTTNQNRIVIYDGTTPRVILGRL